MNCVFCPIQDLCLEYYNKVLILHDYIDERNCPYKELVKESHYEISQKPIIIEAYQTDVELDIETLEGVMHANIGDYIITGVNGEKYPCKPDIFEKTYELVEESNYKMSKELSPLEALTRIVGCSTIESHRPKWQEDYKVVETALKNYEEGLYNAKTYVKHTSNQALFDLLGLALKNVHKSYWKLPYQLYDDVNKSLKALEIIKECLVSEFKLFEKDGEYFILFYFDELHQLTFKLKGKEEYDLLREVLL